MYQIAIAGKRLSDLFHIITPPITTSAGFSVVFSLDWRQQLSYEFLFLHTAWIQQADKKKHCILVPAVPVKSFLHLYVVYLLSTSAELEREGRETTKHTRPNYSASIRVFLSCLGYSLLPVWVVWLTGCAILQSMAFSLCHINAPASNLSSFGQPGPRGQPSRQGSSVEGQCRLSPLSLFLRGWWRKGFKTPQPFLLSLTHFVWFSVVVEKNIMDFLGSVLHNVMVDFDGQ